MRDPLLVVVLLVAAALRLYGIDHGLPEVYNPDEVNIMARSLSVARGLDPGYYLYPSFFFYFIFAVMGGLFAFGWALGRYESLAAFQAQFFTDPTDFYIAARLVGVLCAVATIAVTYGLVQKHFGRVAARAAALFLALAYVGVRDAHYLKHDVPSGLLFVLAVWASERAFETRTIRSYVAAGIVLGVSFATHYYMIFLAPAFVLGHWAFRRREDFRCVLVSGASSAVTFFLLSPFVLLRFPTALAHMRANRQVVVDRSLDSGAALFPSLPSYLEFLLTQGIGYLMFALMVVGIVVMASRSKRQLVLWGAFPAMFFAFITYTFFAGRYVNPILPAICAAAGLGVGVVGSKLGRWAAMAVAIGASLQPLYYVVQIDRLFAGEDTRTVARRFILDHVPSGESVLLQSYSVPLPQSAASFRESLRVNDAEAELDKRGKYASLLEVAERAPQSYELYFLGRGDEHNRIYTPYEDLRAGLAPVSSQGVTTVVLRRAPLPPPKDVRAVFESVRREGALVETIAPANSDSGLAPYLDNEDWPPSARHTHKGPWIEIWSLSPPEP